MLSDPVRRRDALRVGLQSLRLPESTILSAIRLWDEDYAPTRPSALSEYVKDLAQRLGYSIEERHQLRVALYVAIARHDGRIVPAAPPPLPTAPRNGHAATPAPGMPVNGAVRPQRSPAWVVFSAMAGEMLKAVQRDGMAAQDDFNAAIEQHGRAQRLPVEIAVALNRWSRQNAPLDTLAAHPVAGFAPAMHVVYAAAAEAIGPIEADRHLARATTLAEQLPEAQAFAPRRLL